MTKAKAKKRTAKVWVLLDDAIKRPTPLGVFDMRFLADLAQKRNECSSVRPATLTWSEPARRTR